ncbi:MAG: response regulator [Anaerolineales bacterium]|nr:response regulator [Anaerolineales bacterium]
MERKIFNGLIKDLMPHLFDYTALENHPLAGLYPVSEDFHGSRAEYLRETIFKAIEDLRPPGRQPALNAPEWRPYFILYKRYVEGLSPQALSTQLALSERQLRRDHSRALQALAGRLWEQLPLSTTTPDQSQTEENVIGLQNFEIHPESVELNSLLQGVVSTFKNYLKAENIQVRLELISSPQVVMIDRIVLRQVLLSLLNYTVHLQADRLLVIHLSEQPGTLSIQITTGVDEQWKAFYDDEHEDLLETARFWSQKCGAALQECYPEPDRAGKAEISLVLQPTDQPVILVIDDQEPALRMYQRYLNRTRLRVTGVNDPKQALSLARTLHPALILLDVMMPHLDGWEILQALRSDARTKHIPVVVCSAWESTELASSLGASSFLKKPITQKDLLAVVEQLVH